MKALLAVLLLSLSGNAIAEWVEYHTRANGDVFFYDNSRVEKNGYLVKVWNRIRYKTSVMAASSFESFIRIDCDENTSTALQSTFYTDRNWSTPAMATDSREKPKAFIKSNSPTARLAGIVCKD